MKVPLQLLTVCLGAPAAAYPPNDKKLSSTVNVAVALPTTTALSWMSKWFSKDSNAYKCFENLNNCLNNSLIDNSTNNAACASNYMACTKNTII
ncbi:hypothetical protein QL093DRAFT_2358244 [Fusarium oxysporum]|nr:hypothetical protein QL093DRAFT_2358244 [Fusarium oxysporum]